MLAGKWLSAPPHSFGRYLLDPHEDGIRRQSDNTIMYGCLEANHDDGDDWNSTVLPLVAPKH